MNLSEDQVRFLGHHKISPEDVLDARHMKTAEYKQELKRLNKAIAFVAKACGKKHITRLRLSSGHCMECSPQGIAHWRRNQQPGFVYFASSRRLNLLKVGISKLPSDRANHLNRDGYGGATDWLILYRRKFGRSGAIEDAVQALLRAHERSRSYERLGHGTTVEASELFSCDYATARKAVESLAEAALSPAWERL